MDFVIGALAASGAGFFTNPLDVLKTRMQLQGELRARGQHAVHYRNVFHAAIVVVKNDGILGLQKGLPAAVVMHGIRNCVRLGGYQWAHKRGYVTDEHGKTVFYKGFCVSALTGAAGAFFGSPLFLIKTQMQSQSTKSVAVGYQHGRTGTLSAIKEIYTEHGIRGLWRGAGATMLRAVAGSSAQLTSFAMTKDLLNDYHIFDNSPTLRTFSASIVGGVFQALAMQPFDLVSTRLYNQPVDEIGTGLLYKNIPDCFRKIWKTEGVFGFYKGLTAHYMRLGPHGALTLVFWDSLKDLQKTFQSKHQIS
ncbi:hypothetical protein PPYR_12301 [Photinus pyralis]|uniref:Solute carrier family 25 member 35 n=2 Tax=Photinus pyralis TaxID=7054 RepID=A0A1Y1M9C7_PHOPY|nr:solute carrier family 25 member 35-like [Photinus pyralis]XP_031349501.1 solute carrier family 25 member 35-like [Photinus pyralis]XP_031349502.1 solute carrier family 25 member 35-like [Photinus pyralis]XP_031359357.1 solute carrier family 25 member 35-like [Photinus pyralis]XP_031359359.1 solute carrier family 25 member 35-like [Photinus pyralis]XP_031359360.1 solute carrier family 25 member 35-like [Photinus pyralis]KAB0789996.1 hypothetical protein PPYR_15716 [Photinus pyralis]KAB0795